MAAVERTEPFTCSNRQFNLKVLEQGGWFYMTIEDGQTHRQIPLTGKFSRETYDEIAGRGGDPIQEVLAMHRKTLRQFISQGLV